MGALVNWRRLGVLGFSLALYCVTFLLLHDKVGNPLIALAVVPIFLTGHLLGIRAAVFVGGFAIPLNFMLLTLMGDVAMDNFTLPRFFALHLVLWLGGIMLGYAQHLRQSLAHELTRRTQVEEELRHLASHDSLTGLANRQVVMDRLKQCILRCERNKTIVAVLFIDLDHFKPVNDELGHDTGDQVLVAVANRLQEAVRKMDTVARVGGDEFIIVLDTVAKAEDTETIKTTIMEKLSKPFAIGDQTILIGASVGIAVFPRNGTTPDDLIRYADADMYKHKSAPRSRQPPP